MKEKLENTKYNIVFGGKVIFLNLKAKNNLNLLILPYSHSIYDSYNYLPWYFSNFNYIPIHTSV